ncbi:unnamed protein product [Penicillium salamii]|uniref:AAA protein C-terminal winged helix domain-containing protein n=1 Tax=Penicillium salamii TaxID=1612424 RepID=A0A9W4JM83_9EURO|nr:unnamed protein product [Penicillium salamii]
MTLAKALVDIGNAHDRLASIHSGCTELELPGIPIHEAQELMTRADFLPKLDQMNIIAIDAHGIVRAGSMRMQNAFRAISNGSGFAARLQDTKDRLDELESLGRTTELTLKDLTTGQYEVGLPGLNGGREKFYIRKAEDQYHWIYKY